MARWQVLLAAALGVSRLSSRLLRGSGRKQRIRLPPSVTYARHEPAASLCLALGSPDSRRLVSSLATLYHIPGCHTAPGLPLHLTLASPVAENRTPNLITPLELVRPEPVVGARPGVSFPSCWRPSGRLA